MSNKIAGLVFVRNVGSHTILCAVVKSENIPNLKNEHQHLIIGKDCGDYTNLTIDHNISIDLTETACGESIDGLLTSPIWKTN